MRLHALFVETEQRQPNRASVPVASAFVAWRNVQHYGTREQAKREIFARYASFIYMGSGRYGFGAASEYYFDKPLAEYTIADASRAACSRASASRQANTRPRRAEPIGWVRPATANTEAPGSSGPIPGASLSLIQ